jgi:hypothetical protein
MASIRDLEAGTYEWTRAQTRRGRSELIAGGQVVATLTWDRAWNSDARAEADGQAWSFRRRGFFQRAITIEPEERVPPPRVSAKGLRRAFGIVTSSGAAHRVVSDSFTGLRWKFVLDGTDETLIRSHREGVFWVHYATEITALAVGHSDLPFLACLSTWLHPLLDRDVAIAGSAGAAT